MLKQWRAQECPGTEELEQRMDVAKEKFIRLQLKTKERKLPVLVLVEGWGAAGKGSIIGRVIKNMDPRFFKVANMAAPTEEEKRKPFLHRYFVQIPEAGKFTFLDSGWMDAVVNQRLREKSDGKEYAEQIDSIKRFERQLTDNGYMVMKLFFHITRKEQKKRIHNLLEHKDTAWRVSNQDQWQNKHYEACENVFDQYLEDTNVSGAPWYIVDAMRKKWAELQVLELLNNGMEIALQNESIAVPILQNVFPMQKIPKLSEISLDKQITEEDYRQELDGLQKRLGELHNRLYRKQVPVVIVYEGWDAAGKGGNIKRITGALDPRGYEVHPIASPEPHEKARHYLWRFWNRLPKTGHIAIYDRSWYGRVMVERLEGYCKSNDWMRAFNEINEFEQELTKWGAIVIKFWVHIDKDTQLERFTLRQNTPEKQWKITDEDWRNREKWDAYEIAVNEMIQKTSTVAAPWHILEAVDKKYARIKALTILTEALEKALN